MAKKRQQYLYHCHLHQQPFVDSWRENLWKLLILRYRAESLIQKLEKATGLKKNQIAEILRSISLPIGGSEVGELSRARIAQRPLLAIDGEFAFGCYWFKYFKSAFCFEDLLSEKGKREAGAFFVKAIAKQFQSWGVDFVRTNVAYSFSQGAGDIDLLIVWGEFIFCCECKAFLGLPRYDRFRWKLKELRRAAAQAAKGVRFIEEHPRTFEQKASLPLELCRGRRVLPVIILHNVFMSGWKVDGVPVVNAAFVAMHRPHRGDEFEKLVNNPPDLASLKLPTRVEPWHTIIGEFHFSGT